ncbi:tetratricopeptide repeat protein [Peristeroidobacter soli]|uniref:tetratricopeptide repeat protein n=1 Tax=Peristeroidobacter soli TaxID=2497877 RepID=UPI00101DFFA3|nr:tetratricopeptide repeat protein [Peristeroidobacter soli]
MTISRLVRWTAIVATVVASAACSNGEARKVGYLERGEKYFAAANYDKARIEARNALQIDPNYVEARYLAGRVAEKKAEIREAAGNYQAVLDVNPKFSPARAALARLLLFGGMPDKSLELVEAGLKDDPQNAALLTVRGAVQAQRGLIPAALEDAETAIKVAPNDEFTISLLASLYKQSARLDKAIEVINRGLEQLPKNVELRIVLADLEASRENYAAVEQQLKQVVTLEPKSFSHHARLARFYLSRKDLPKAEATWRDAIAAVADGKSERKGSDIAPRLALIDLLWSQRGEEAGLQEMQAMMAKDPKDAELKLAIGGYLEKQGKADEAEKLYQEVSKADDKDAQGLNARTRLASLYLKRNDIERAQSLINQVLEENPRDNDALALRANLALQKGDTSTAITDLRAVLRDQPNSTPVMRALAQAHLKNNEVALAEETLRSALQSNPSEAPTRKALAQLLLQQGKADQARLILDPVAGMQGLSDDPEILDAQFKAQLATRDFAAAQQTAEKAQQLRPKAAMGWYYAGLVAETQKNAELARQNYEKALELQPQVNEPLTALVRLDAVAKDNKRALARLATAIERTPNNAVAHNLRGELLIAERQPDAAIGAFETAIEHAPEWWMPYRGLALAQLSQKQNDAAVAAFQRGIERTKAGALSIDLAALYERAGKPDDAIKVYEQWVSREPKSSLANRNLAMLLLNYREDRTSVQRATQLAESLANSNDPAALEIRGWAKYKNGDFQGAVNLLRDAASNSKESATVRYHLGMAQLRAGDKAGARESLQAALDHGKPFFGIDEARATLDQLKQSG